MQPSEMTQLVFYTHAVVSKPSLHNHFQELILATDLSREMRFAVLAIAQMMDTAKGSGSSLREVVSQYRPRNISESAAFQAMLNATQ